MNKIYEKLCLIFQIILFFIFKIKTKTFRIFVKLTDLWEYIDSPAICNTKNFTYITLYFMKFISFLWHLGPLLMRITYHLCSCLLPLWCSNLATKIFLPNMPWFLHTCTSLPIPVYSSWNTSSFCIWEMFLCFRPHSKVTFSVELFFVLRPDWCFCTASALCTHSLMLTFLPLVIIDFHVCHFLLVKSFSGPRKMCPCILSALG